MAHRRAHDRRRHQRSRPQLPAGAGCGSCRSRVPHRGRVHEWRKRAKYSWYHAQILEPLAPSLLHATADAYHELSAILGDHHDLVVLVDTIAPRPEGLDERSVTDLTQLADRRRRDLEAHALRVAGAVYADPPKRFRKELAALWKAAA